MNRERVVRDAQRTLRQLAKGEQLKSADMYGGKDDAGRWAYGAKRLHAHLVAAGVITDNGGVPKSPGRRYMAGPGQESVLAELAADPVQVSSLMWPTPAAAPPTADDFDFAQQAEEPGPPVGLDGLDGARLALAVVESVGRLELAVGALRREQVAVARQVAILAAALGEGDVARTLADAASAAEADLLLDGVEEVAGG